MLHAYYSTGRTPDASGCLDANPAALEGRLVESILLGYDAQRGSKLKACPPGGCFRRLRRQKPWLLIAARREPSTFLRLTGLLMSRSQARNPHHNWLNRVRHRQTTKTGRDGDRRDPNYSHYRQQHDHGPPSILETANATDTANTTDEMPSRQRKALRPLDAQNDLAAALALQITQPVNQPGAFTI